MDSVNSLGESSSTPNSEHELYKDYVENYFSNIDSLGVYEPTRFVMRLSFSVKEKLSQLKSNYLNLDEIEPDTLEAYATYIHETIHWWQHIGSTSGLMLSLAFPAQTHVTLKFLKQLINKKYLKKPLLNDLVQQQDLAPDVKKILNLIVNKHFDLEFCKALLIDPANCQGEVKNAFFESPGQSYSFLWASILWLLGSTLDKKMSYLPDPRNWESIFYNLNQQRAIGFYYGSPVFVPKIGVKAMFEGQARFSQIQFLHFTSGKKNGWKEFEKAGYLNGIYVECFNLFLELTESAWPIKINDPIVALFLLVCDIAMNPSEGFPFDISSHENFVQSVDPGWRFFKLCEVIRSKHQDLKTLIENYSASEYYTVCLTLCNEISTKSPLEIAQKIYEWSDKHEELKDLLHEEELFNFQDENTPIRVIFSKFIRYQKDKLSHPEFFCWPGYWLSGGIADEIEGSLFMKHGAIFRDDENRDVVATLFQDKPVENIQATLNKYFRWIIIYEYTRQWVVNRGDFSHDFFWITSQHSLQDLANFAKEAFLEAFGIAPESIEVAKLI